MQSDPTLQHQNASTQILLDQTTQNNTQTKFIHNNDMECFPFLELLKFFQGILFTRVGSVSGFKMPRQNKESEPVLPPYEMH